MKLRAAVTASSDRRSESVLMYVIRPTVPMPLTSTPSYSCCAMDIVRLGVMPSRRLASCWSVEVMKGGEGLRCFLPRFTLCTLKGLPVTAAMTASVSASLCSSALPSDVP